MPFSDIKSKKEYHVEPLNSLLTNQGFLNFRVNMFKLEEADKLESLIYVVKKPFDLIKETESQDFKKVEVPREHEALANHTQDVTLGFL